MRQLIVGILLLVGSSAFGADVSKYTIKADTTKVDSGNVFQVDADGHAIFGADSLVSPLEVNIVGAVGAPATSGVTQNGLLRVRSNTNTGALDVGVTTSTGYPWMQAVLPGNLATELQLKLQQNGGGLWVGNSATPTDQNYIYGKTLLGGDDSDGAVFILRNSTADSTGSGPSVMSLGYTSRAPDNNDQMFIQCYDTTATRMVVYSDGDVVNADDSYGALSDTTLKTNITEAPSQLRSLRRVDVREFSWKSDPEQLRHIRPSAQELQAIYPDMVREVTYDSVTVEATPTGSVVVHTPTKKLAVESSKMTWRTVRAVQELSATVDSLRIAFEDLKQRVADLEAGTNRKQEE